MASLSTFKNNGMVPDETEAIDEGENIELSQSAQKRVFWLRVLTSTAAFVLLAIAIGACFAVNIESRKSEKEDFEHDFIELGEKLVTSFETVVEQRFGIIDSFSMDLTSQAGGSWPFFTPPDFARRGETVASLAQVMFFFLLPIVSEENRQAWDTYSVDNLGWRTEGIAYERGVPLASVNASEGFTTITNVHYGGPPKPQDGPGPYCPIWCFYPADNRPISNIDMLADPEHKVPIATVMAAGKPAFEVSYDYWDPEVERDNRYAMLKSNKETEYLDDPHAISFFPIFDGFGENKRVAAMFLVIIYWRTYFDGLLPPGADGIIVILENTCDQQYTYQVDGIHSRFIGHGDLHDPKYDYLETGTSLLKDDDTNQEGCSYSIRVYPSQEFEDAHYTKQPLVYSTALAVMFLFTSVCGLMCIRIRNLWMVKYTN